MVLNRRNSLLLGGGCLLLLVLVIGAGLMVVAAPFWLARSTSVTQPAAQPRVEQPRTTGQTVVPAPTFTVVPPAVRQAVSTTVEGAGGATLQQGATTLGSTENLLSGRFAQLNPGVVSIQVFVQRAGEEGQGAGSGFILDTQGHIVTNNHVVEGATQVIVVFFNGQQVYAEIVGSDDDSDLAVIRVDALPEGVYPLPLADSSNVQVGDWAIAIGNPFGLSGSMTLGIISAVGRTIPSGVAQFSIPEAIQTDAAINPGNSGGPLFNLAGEVIGVNAQIRTGGSNANSGVGFAIPTNIVRLVVPTLIAEGAYQWPWLGIAGENVNLVLAEANELPSQAGAYLVGVVEGGPADTAGLQGSTGQTNLQGLLVPTGGDVVIAADGEPLASFNDLLDWVAFKLPGDEIVLTVLRNGQQLDIPVTLAPRPDLAQPVFGEPTP
jgi:2-alkenal reductase